MRLVTTIQKDGNGNPQEKASSWCRAQVERKEHRGGKVCCGQAPMRTLVQQARPRVGLLLGVECGDSEQNPSHMAKASTIEVSWAVGA
jgi:hypothetical protein